MSIPEHIDHAVRDRVESCLADGAALQVAGFRRRSTRASSDPARRAKRTRHLVKAELFVAEALANGNHASMLHLSIASQKVAEVMLGDTRDFLPIAFVEQAREAANAVGCVLALGSVADGTCFMISPELLITNHHVIPTAAEAATRSVRFNFERDAGGTLRKPATFSLNVDPENGGCFVASGENDLDYAIIALGERIDPKPAPLTLGRCPLVNGSDVNRLSRFVNIIQHPRGEPKSVVLRENRVVVRADASPRVLHYLGDTAPKSSGAPVFSDNWEVVALHHHGFVTDVVTGPDGRQTFVGANEGIRTSAIIADLARRKDTFSKAERDLLGRALGAPFSS